MRKNVHLTGQTAGSPRQSDWLDKGGEEWSLYAASGQRKYLNDEERQRFIAAAMRAHPKARTLCLTLAYIGCRLSEALNLTARDIEITSGLIAIRSLKKRGKSVIRQVPAPPKLLSEIALVHELEGWPADAGTRHLWPWCRTRAWEIVKEVMAEAGVHNLPASPKGLRHAFGVHAVLCGVPLNLIQKWLGHANIATTAIYTNVLGPEERRIAARMW